MASRSQVNRSVIAQRALISAARRPGASTSTASTSRPSTNLLARTITEVAPQAAPVRNRKAPRMTATQRDSEGKRSAWSASPYFFTDPAWSVTASER